MRSVCGENANVVPFVNILQNSIHFISNEQQRRHTSRPMSPRRGAGLLPWPSWSQNGARRRAHPKVSGKGSYITKMRLYGVICQLGPRVRQCGFDGEWLLHCVCQTVSYRTYFNRLNKDLAKNKYICTSTTDDPLVIFVSARAKFLSDITWCNRIVNEQ